MIRIAVLATVVLTLCGATAAAAPKPGWSVVDAETYLEYGGRIVIPEAIAAAKEQLRIAKLVGGKHGLEKAEAELAIVQGGFEIDHARCVGLTKATGGYRSFGCKVQWSDSLIGLEGKASGRLVRNAVTGKWKWTLETYDAREM